MTELEVFLWLMAANFLVICVSVGIVTIHHSELNIKEKFHAVVEFGLCPVCSIFTFIWFITGVFVITNPDLVKTATLGSRLVISLCTPLNFLILLLLSAEPIEKIVLTHFFRYKEA